MSEFCKKVEVRLINYGLLKCMAKKDRSNNKIDLCNIQASVYKTRTYVSNNQSATLIHKNSLQFSNVFQVTYLAKHEIQTFHVRYQPPSLEDMILTLPKLK